MQNFSTTLSRLHQSSRANKTIAFCAALVVVAVGYYLIASHATGFVVGIEPENGTRTANASLINDTSASAGKAVQFNAAAPVPPPPPPPPGGRSCPAYPAFPDAGCTGVPASFTCPGSSASLTSLSTVNGDLTTSSDNQIICGKDIKGSVIVQNDNVTIMNSRIRDNVQAFTQDQTGLLIEDSEIAPTTYQVGNYPPVSDGNYTLLRVHVHAFQDGPRVGVGYVIIRDSISDDIAFAAAEHPDSFQSYGPGSKQTVTLDHNVLSGCTGNSSDKGSSAIFWSDKPGANSSLDVVHNLFKCGQFSIRINDTGSGGSTTCDNNGCNRVGVIANVHDNQVVRGSYVYGPTECDNSRAFDATRGDGVKWSNNTFSDNGQQIPTACVN
jgi:hypothetical protein